MLKDADPQLLLALKILLLFGFKALSTFLFCRFWIVGPPLYLKERRAKRKRKQGGKQEVILGMTDIRLHC